MKLIDSHCHLCHDRLRPDVVSVLARASQGGVIACVAAASDIHEAASARALAHEHEKVWFTAGIHPHEAKDAGDHYPQDIGQLVADAKCVAIGEIGLDYHYDFSPRPVQQDVFARQLALARELGKPVVIHTREAFEDTLAILLASDLDGARVVFHSFAEGPEAGRRVLDLGATISFSGMATFKNAGAIRQTALATPANRILVETDSPFLSPEPVRNMKTNEPMNVAHVAARLAAIRNVDAEGFASQTTENAIRFFSMRGLDKGEAQ